MFCDAYVPQNLDAKTLIWYQPKSFYLPASIYQTKCIPPSSFYEPSMNTQENAAIALILSVREKQSPPLNGFLVSNK